MWTSKRRSVFTLAVFLILSLLLFLSPPRVQLVAAAPAPIKVRGNRIMGKKDIINAISDSPFEKVFRRSNLTMEQKCAKMLEYELAEGKRKTAASTEFGVALTSNSLKFLRCVNWMPKYLYFTSGFNGTLLKPGYEFCTASTKQQKEQQQQPQGPNKKLRYASYFLAYMQADLSPPFFSTLWRNQSKDNVKRKAKSQQEEEVEESFWADVAIPQNRRLEDVYPNSKKKKEASAESDNSNSNTESDEATKSTPNRRKQEEKTAAAAKETCGAVGGLCNLRWLEQDEWLAGVSNIILMGDSTLLRNFFLLMRSNDVEYQTKVKDLTDDWVRANITLASGRVVGVHFLRMLHTSTSRFIMDFAFDQIMLPRSLVVFSMGPHDTSWLVFRRPMPRFRRSLVGNWPAARSYWLKHSINFANHYAGRLAQFEYRMRRILLTAGGNSSSGAPTMYVNSVGEEARIELPDDDRRSEKQQDREQKEDSGDEKEEKEEAAKNIKNKKKNKNKSRSGVWSYLRPISLIREHYFPNCGHPKYSKYPLITRCRDLLLPRVVPFYRDVLRGLFAKINIPVVSMDSVIPPCVMADAGHLQKWCKFLEMNMLFQAFRLALLSDTQQGFLLEKELLTNVSLSHNETAALKIFNNGMKQLQVQYETDERIGDLIDRVSLQPFQQLKFPRSFDQTFKNGTGELSYGLQVAVGERDPRDPNKTISLGFETFRERDKKLKAKLTKEKSGDDEDVSSGSNKKQGRNESPPSSSSSSNEDMDGNDAERPQGATTIQLTAESENAGLETRDDQAEQRPASSKRSDGNNINNNKRRRRKDTDAAAPPDVQEAEEAAAAATAVRTAALGHAGIGLEVYGFLGSTMLLFCFVAYNGLRTAPHSRASVSPSKRGGEKTTTTKL